MNTTPQFSLLRKLQFTLVAILGFAFVIIGVGELIMRLTSPEKGVYYRKADTDDKLGWKAKAHYTQTYEVNTKRKQVYPVKFATLEGGFRHFGEVSTDKQKLLVVGDSYTQAVEANTDSIYAKHLANALDMELFCYGQAGYGTLQQTLVIEAYLDTIRPDMLVLQMCGNDLIDNHAKLEYQSNYKVGLRRPYLNADNTIAYQVPKPLVQRLLEPSLFLDLIRKKLAVVSYDEEQVAQYKIGKQGKGYKPYAESLEITGRILDRLQQSLEGIPMIVLLVSSDQPYTSDIVALCQERGIPCFPEPLKHLKQLEFKKLDVKSSDGYHWTELGHRIIAEQLLIQLDSVQYNYLN